jgi:hypothetical protein
LVLACAPAFLLFFGIAGIDPAAAAQATTHTVVIDSLKYEPEAVTAKRGDPKETDVKYCGISFVTVDGVGREAA